MTDKTPEEIRGAMDERGISVFLSEQAAARITRILTSQQSLDAMALLGA